jgi:hypothetical protein
MNKGRVPAVLSLDSIAANPTGKGEAEQDGTDYLVEKIGQGQNEIWIK